MKKKNRAAGGRRLPVKRYRNLLAGWLIILMVLAPVQSALGSCVLRPGAMPGSAVSVAAASRATQMPFERGKNPKGTGRTKAGLADPEEKELEQQDPDRSEQDRRAPDQSVPDGTDRNQKVMDQSNPGQTGLIRKSPDQGSQDQKEPNQEDSKQSDRGKEAPKQEDPEKREPEQREPEQRGEETENPEKPGSGASDAGEKSAAGGETADAAGEETSRPADREEEPGAASEPAGRRAVEPEPADADRSGKSDRFSGTDRSEVQKNPDQGPAAAPQAAEERGGTDPQGAATGISAGAGATETTAASAGTDAAADADLEEAPWMTVSEFNRAYESVTSGAMNAGAATLSSPRIVSKESEINYEDLGIGTHVSGHPGHTTPINVRDGDGNDYVGVCVVPDDRGWPKGTVLPNVTRVTDASMIRLYYYTMLDSYGEDLAKSRGFGSDSKKVAVAACHEAMSMRYAQLAGIEYDRPNVKSNLSALISAYRSGVASKPTPDADRVFVYISARTQSGGHWMQAYVFGRIKEEDSSSLILEKVSSDPDMRHAYNLYYCLHETASGGTVNFRMYTDKACTKRAVVYTDANMTNELDPIPVGLSGKSGLWNQAVFYCEPGTYYLKELTTPRGYQPHSEPFGPYTLQEGKGKTIKVENDPMYAKAGVLKKDAKTGKGLGGAKFSLYADLEDARNEAEPMGVFTTGSDGRSNLLDVLAGRTYYVREIQAPEGYKPIDGVRALNAAEGFRDVAWTEFTNEPDTGTVQVMKASADPAVDLDAAGTPYSLKGAQYGLFDADGTRAGTLTTKENGLSEILTVPAGKYTLKETKPSPGFAIDAQTYNVTVTAAKPVLVKSAEPPRMGSVQVKKSPSDDAVDLTSAETPYSLAGAEYTLYDAGGEAVSTMTTDTAGVSNVLTVLCGSYTVKETKPSPGFDPDPATYPVTAKPDGEVIVESREPVQKARITLRKCSSEEKEEKVKDTLPIAGAVYGLYASRDDAREERAAIGTFLVREDGSANVVEVFAGRTYYVKETKTPDGYLPDEVIHEVEAKSLEETVTVRSEDRLIFGGVKVCKRDLETGGSAPLGGASLEGAILKIYNDGDKSVYADGKKILPGAEALTLTTGADGMAQTKERALSYGQYRIEEVTAPEGYTKEGARPVRFSIEQDGVLVDLTKSAETSVQDRVVRGDFSIRKINGYTQKRMAGVTFEVTALDPAGKELEKHRFTTDKNGVFESTAAFAKGQIGAGAGGPAPAGDAAGEADTAPGAETEMQKAEKQETEKQGETKGQAETAESGRLWFGAGTEPDDLLGALPYGDYHIEEIEGENNWGMKMFADDFSIYEEGQVLALGNIENTLKPVLETELVDEDGDHFADQKGIVTLTDTVTYAGMEAYIGKEVTFHGVIYVRETGQPLVIDGRTVECVKTKKILSPASTVQLRFTFDASRAQGRTLVCYEYASEAVARDPAADSGTQDAADPEPADSSGEGGDEDAAGPVPSGSVPAFLDSTNGGTDIAAHTDPEDEAQSVHLLSIETDARDQLTGMHIGEAREGAVTVDHVTCRGLTPGQDYLVAGVLVDKSTGRPLRTGAGEQITAQASFTARESTEVVDLTFRYDASLLEGTTVVAFERLYLDGAHSPQTQGGEPSKPDGQSGESPDGPDAGPDRPGINPPIAVHEDPDDENQSIRYPQLRTHAAGGEEGGRTVTAEGTVTVYDRVTWKNLLPDRTYRLQGILMDKSTGRAFEVGGRPVTATADFAVKEREGETVLAFPIDADRLRSSLTGETLCLVAFEELYIRAEEKTDQESPESGKPQTEPGAQVAEEAPGAQDCLVASHQDLADPDQTVYLRFPPEPEKPEKPEKPEEPEKPEKPGKQPEPEKTGERKRTGTPASPETIREAKSAKTGDTTGVALYLLLTLGSAAVLAAFAVRRHKKRK